MSATLKYIARQFLRKVQLCDVTHSRIYASVIVHPSLCLSQKLHGQFGRLNRAAIQRRYSVVYIIINSFNSPQLPRFHIIDRNLMLLLTYAINSYKLETELLCYANLTLHLRLLAFWKINVYSPLPLFDVFKTCN